MKRHIVIAALTLAATVGACGGSSSGSTGLLTSKTSQSANSEFNNEDVMFAQMMIPHHEQAIEMADMALDPKIGASQAIFALATQIKGAQDPEITQMKNLLTAWDKALSVDSGVDHGSMMSGMMSIEEMDALGMKMGGEFNAAWAKAMIAHHLGAIQMAKEVLAKGTNAEIRALAEAIVAGQSTEIETLKPLAGP